jgi:hypothetical protein
VRKIFGLASFGGVYSEITFIKFFKTVASYQQYYIKKTKHLLLISGTIPDP